MRFSARMNQLGAEIAQAMTTFQVPPEVFEPSWVTWEELVGKVPFNLQPYLKFSRNNFIPHGGLCYMPEDWAHCNTFEDGIWSVCCSFKDSENQDMAKCFMYTVLAHLISMETTVEIHFEESDSVFYSVCPYTGSDCNKLF
jgi:hypothetical protein